MLTPKHCKIWMKEFVFLQIRKESRMLAVECIAIMLESPLASSVTLCINTPLLNETTGHIK